MRLIDADKLIEEIKQEIDMRYMYSPKGFINVINNQPTAFDVDKVLKQLSEKNRAYYERGLMYEKNGKISSALSINDRAEGIEIAYEIVKAGGLNE